MTVVPYGFVFIVVPKGRSIKLSIVWGKENPAFERAFDIRSDRREHLVQANSVNTQAFTKTVNGVANWNFTASQDTTLTLEPTYKKEANGLFERGAIGRVTHNLYSCEAKTFAYPDDGIGLEIATVSWTVE